MKLFLTLLGVAIVFSLSLDKEQSEQSTIPPCFNEKYFERLGDLSCADHFEISVLEAFEINGREYTAFCLDMEVHPIFQLDPQFDNPNFHIRYYHILPIEYVSRYPGQIKVRPTDAIFEICSQWLNEDGEQEWEPVYGDSTHENIAGNFEKEVKVIQRQVSNMRTYGNSYYSREDLNDKEQGLVMAYF